MKMILLLTILSFATVVQAQSVIKETFIYSVKGQDTLRLDRYSNPSFQDIKPCVIFVFGGGFVGGTRDDEGYIPYFEFLANEGYAVASIDYRLGLKKAQESGEMTGDLTNMFSFMRQSVAMAVEDIVDATDYIIKNADKWQIDPQMIVASGSSAGALTVLHAEYDLCNEGPLTQKLPSDFNYAGVIAFAGAILSEGELTWQYRPAPIMFFHGDADKNVPYNALVIDNAGFEVGIYGSLGISSQFNELGYSYYFHSVENAAHEISWKPMQENLDEIRIFLNRFVRNKQPLIINTSSFSMDSPEVKKDFELEDYLRTNNLIP